MATDLAVGSLFVLKGGDMTLIHGVLIGGIVVAYLLGRIER